MNYQADLYWSSLPDELKTLKQWCIAGDNKAPHVAGHDALIPVKVTDKEFMSFEDACKAAKYFQKQIGFVLTEEDPFTFIDIDIKDSSTKGKNGKPHPTNLWTTTEQVERYHNLLQTFGTYTEISKSGKGLHLITVGNIGKGRRRDGIEVYSKERFMICTGKSISYCQLKWNSINHTWNICDVNSAKINIRPTQTILNNMIQQLVPVDNVIELEELEEEYTDNEIFERASTADNAEKFLKLCDGKWAELGYPSQSEADLSLLSMLTFYSKSNSQVRRIFRCTQLGQREKAVKDDKYLNRCLKLIRTREYKEEETRTQVQKTAEALMRQAQLDKEKEVERARQISAEVDRQNQKDISHTAISGNILDWPPGMAGTIAKFIYHSSYRPVREVSIVTALGFLAGVCGKAYNIPQSGLNQYIILVANSGIGKEAMHSGISLILDKLRTTVPLIEEFIDFTKYVSGPALTKAVLANPSKLNVYGEFGKRLKQMAIDDGRDTPIAQLRTAITDLYQKSSATSIYGGLGYSNGDKSVKSIKGAAYSIIGETTPKTFYMSLTEGMMEDGFLSRFSIIEYKGDRPAANENPITTMDEGLLQSLISLTSQALNLINSFQYQQVGATNEAIVAMKAFDKKCDDEINSSENDAYRQMWNRAHLKSLRLAGLLAVADNWIKPVIQPHHYQWAKQLVDRDIELMMRKLNDGDVGIDDHSRELKVLALMEEFTRNLPASSYDISTRMWRAGIITRRYLSMKTNRVTSFLTHKLGSSRALDQTIQILIDNGYLAVEPNVANEFGFSGKAYRVLKLRDKESLKS